MKQIEKVKRGLRCCIAAAETEGKGCEGCPYAKEEDCAPVRDREALEMIEAMQAQMKTQPMPCQVGDTLWLVYEKSAGVVNVERITCEELLWDGEVWMAGEGDGCFDEVDKEVVWTSIKLACKEVERRLEAYRNDG